MESVPGGLHVPGRGLEEGGAVRVGHRRDSQTAVDAPKDAEQRGGPTSETDNAEIQLPLHRDASVAPTPTPPSPCPPRRARSCTPARGPVCDKSRTRPRPPCARWGRCPARSQASSRSRPYRWKVQRVEARPQVAALLLVPGERRPVVPEIAGERRHVVGRVRQPQHVVADEFARRRLAETPVVVVRRDDGELLD